MKYTSPFKLFFEHPLQALCGNYRMQSGTVCASVTENLPDVRQCCWEVSCPGKWSTNRRCIIPPQFSSEVTPLWKVKSARKGPFSSRDLCKRKMSRITGSSGGSICVWYLLTLILDGAHQRACSQRGSSLSLFQTAAPATVCAWSLAMPVAQINPRRLSTCNRTHSAQGHVHLFHYFLRGPNTRRRVI